MGNPLSGRDLPLPLSKRASQWETGDWSRIHDISASDPQAWLDANVRDKDETLFYAAALVALFPYLRLVRRNEPMPSGLGIGQSWIQPDEGSKFWAQHGGWGGQIYSSTGEWNNVDWKGGAGWGDDKPWSARYADGVPLQSRLDKVVNHPLFKTLPPEDQEHIRLKANIPEDRKRTDLRKILTPDVFSGWSDDPGWTITEYRPARVAAAHHYPRFIVQLDLPRTAELEGEVRLVWEDEALDKLMPAPTEQWRSERTMEKHLELPSDVVQWAQAVKGLLIEMGPVFQQIRNRREAQPHSMSERLFPARLFAGWWFWNSDKGHVKANAQSAVADIKFMAEDVVDPGVEAPFGVAAELSITPREKSAEGYPVADFKPEHIRMMTEDDLHAIRERIADIGQELLSTALTRGSAHDPDSPSEGGQAADDAEIDLTKVFTPDLFSSWEEPEGGWSILAYSPGRVHAKHFRPEAFLSVVRPLPGTFGHPGFLQICWPEEFNEEMPIKGGGSENCFNPHARSMDEFAEAARTVAAAMPQLSLMLEKRRRKMKDAPLSKAHAMFPAELFAGWNLHETGWGERGMRARILNPDTTTKAFFWAIDTTRFTNRGGFKDVLASLEEEGKPKMRLRSEEDLQAMRNRIKDLGREHMMRLPLSTREEDEADSLPLSRRAHYAPMQSPWDYDIVAETAEALPWSGTTRDFLKRFPGGLKEWHEWRRRALMEEHFRIEDGVMQNPNKVIDVVPAPGFEKDASHRVRPVGDSQLEIKESPIHGLGLFAAGPFKEGDTICRALRKVRSTGIADFDLLQTRWGRKINHREEPNARPVLDPKTDDVLVVATEDIAKGDEITVNYEEFGKVVGRVAEDLPPETRIEVSPGKLETALGRRRRPLADIVSLAPPSGRYADDPDLVDVKEFDLETEDGRAVRLDRRAATALAKAQKDLPEGHRFCVFNGFHSQKDQERIHKKTERMLKKTHPASWKKLVKKYMGSIADSNPMSHRSGLAADVRILAPDGKELDLGGMRMSETDQTDHYEKDPLSRREAAIRDNRRMLKEVMKEHGFKNNPDEWWHWGYEPPLSAKAADPYELAAAELLGKGRFDPEEHGIQEDAADMTSHVPERVRARLHAALPPDKIVRVDENRLRVADRLLPNRGERGRWIHVINYTREPLSGILPKLAATEGEISVSRLPSVADFGEFEDFIAAVFEGEAEALWDLDVDSSTDPWTGRRKVSEGMEEEYLQWQEPENEGWLVPAKSRLIAVVTNSPELAEEARSLGYDARLMGHSDLSRSREFQARGILSRRDIVRRAGRRPGVDEEYIWLWDDGIRHGKGVVSGPRLKSMRNVEKGEEIKGVDHRMLADSLDMSGYDAHRAPRGFVTYNTDGSIEVTTYGEPFSRLLETDEQVYNAVERAFQLMPGGYKQTVLPMQRGSHEKLMELPTGTTGDADDEEYEEEEPERISPEMMLTPEETEEMARKVAEAAIDGLGSNALQTMQENPDFGPGEVAESGEAIHSILYDLALDLHRQAGVDERGILRQILMDLQGAVFMLRPDIKEGPLRWGLERGLKRALDIHERMHGFMKLNRNQQRAVGEDWNAVLRNATDVLMDKLKEQGQDGEAVWWAYLHNNPGVMCDYAPEYLADFAHDSSFLSDDVERKYHALVQIRINDGAYRHPQVEELDRKIVQRACELINMRSRGTPWPGEEQWADDNKETISMTSKTDKRAERLLNVLMSADPEILAEAADEADRMGFTAMADVLDADLKFEAFKQAAERGLLGEPTPALEEMPTELEGESPGGPFPISIRQGPGAPIGKVPTKEEVVEAVKGQVPISPEELRGMDRGELSFLRDRLSVVLNVVEKALGMEPTPTLRPEEQEEHEEREVFRGTFKRPGEASFLLSKRAAEEAEKAEKSMLINVQSRFSDWTKDIADKLYKASQTILEACIQFSDAKKMDEGEMRALQDKVLQGLTSISDVHGEFYGMMLISDPWAKFERTTFGGMETASFLLSKRAGAWEHTPEYAIEYLKRHEKERAKEDETKWMFPEDASGHAALLKPLNELVSEAVPRIKEEAKKVGWELLNNMPKDEASLRALSNAAFALWIQMNNTGNLYVKTVYEVAQRTAGQMEEAEKEKAAEVKWRQLEPLARDLLSKLEAFSKGEDRFAEPARTIYLLNGQLKEGFRPRLIHQIEWDIKRAQDVLQRLEAGTMQPGDHYKEE